MTKTGWINLERTDLAWYGTSCPDTLTLSHLNKAVTVAAAVVTENEHRKRIKCASLPSAYLFFPIATETLGALGDDTTHFL